jgi:hypothetical protein
LTEGKGKSKAKVKTRSKPYVTRVRLTALPLHTSTEHAAPAIAIDTDDEDEPQQKTGMLSLLLPLHLQFTFQVHIDFTNPVTFSVKAKTKTATKASKTPVVPGGLLTYYAAHPCSYPLKAVKRTAALKPAKLVPDSNSESESSDDSEEHNVSDAGGPNAEEFLIEVRLLILYNIYLFIIQAPRIIGKRKSVPIVSDEDNEVHIISPYHSHR